MTTGSVGALVLGMALGGLVGTADAAQTNKPPASTTQPDRSGTAEVTGTYRGFSSKWINLWTADHKQLRFEVDPHAVPGWQKLFKVGDQITITYRDLSSRHLPMAIGMRKADALPKKK